MRILFALGGCGDTPMEAVDGQVKLEVREVPTPAEAEARIATTPDRDGSQRAPVVAVALPAGEPVVRDCRSGSEKESRRGGGGAGVGRVGGRGPAPSPVVAAPPAAKPRPAPRPPPPSQPAGDAAMPSSAPTPQAVSGGVASEPPMAEPSPADDGAPAFFRSRKDNDAGGAGDPGTIATRPAEPPAEEASERQQAAKGRDEKNDVTRTVTELPRKRPEPVVDWGATVFLSNDDSMSLASAQRVLHAFKQRQPLKPSEVRPHELLNYFSFDTVAPPGDATFGVLGAAEQDGDTLTVSLAVRGANPPRQPLDLTLVVDRSCSMTAEDRVGYTRRGLELLASELQRGDRVDLVLFDDKVCTPLENWVAGRDEPQLLRDAVAQLQPMGSTDLDAGLREGYRIQTSREAGDVHGRNRRLLVVTDAILNTGRVDPALVSEIGTHLDQHGIRLSGVGVGLDFNDKVLDLLTEKGKGAYVYLGSDAVVDRVFGPGFDSLVRTVAHDVRFALDLPDSLAMERFYGEESSTDAADVQPIHYSAGTTQLFLQDLKVRDGRVVREDPITMRIEYRDVVTGEPEVQELRTTVGALLDGDPHNLRKGRALMAFADVAMASAMHAGPCGAPLEAYRDRAALLADDAEIAFVNGLVGRTCGVDLSTAVARGVELKLKVDADQPIAEVALDCGGRHHLEKLSGGDTVARFSSVAPGACRVKLDGQVPMVAELEVPSTGGDVRCVVRAGRLSCG